MTIKLIAKYCGMAVLVLASFLALAPLKLNASA